MQGEGQKTQVAPTDWATDFPVWATEKPVTLTVQSQTHIVLPAREGLFRARKGENSEQLTNDRPSHQEYAPYRQNQTRRVGVISGRPTFRWISRVLSRLTNVNSVIAHCCFRCRV